MKTILLLVATSCLLCVGAVIGMLFPYFLMGLFLGSSRTDIAARIVFPLSCVAIVAVSVWGLVAFKCVQRKWWLLGALLVGGAIGAFWNFGMGLCSGWSFVCR